MRRIGLVALAALAAAWAPPADWGDVGPGETPTESHFICRKVRGKTIPAADVADAKRAEPGLKGCDAEALYYGIGMPADPVKARQCAILHSPAGGGEADTHFDGDELLMVIYANGSGVPHDLDLAIHLSCVLESAWAEHDSRVKTLTALKTKPQATPFDYCQDVTSGYAMGVCAAHDQRFGAARRAAGFARLTSRFTPEQAKAFEDLRAATQAYAEARGGSETDLSGTARGAFAIGEEEARWKAFQTLLTQVAGQQPPAATAAQAKAADTRLNVVYRKVLAARSDDWGTVDLDGIRETERAWIRYRDAWLAFGRAVYPAVSQDGLAAHLTRERTKLLEAFIEPS